ncbi:MAG: PLAT/LH2 domain-containing protein [Chitinophagales bacterium]
MKRLTILFVCFLALQFASFNHLFAQPRRTTVDHRKSTTLPTFKATRAIKTAPVATTPTPSNSGVSYKTSSGTSDFLPSRPANFEDVAVWRLQVKITTDGRDDADTDDTAYIQIGNSTQNRFYLDKGGDDRERNHTDVYDLVNVGVNKIGDIRFLKIAKIGTDGWCIKNIDIMVNNVATPLYRKSFGSCQWIDGNDGHPSSITISSSELRQYGGWKYTSQNQGSIWLPPLGILPRDMFENIVESLFGHLRHVQSNLKGIYWGHYYGNGWVEAAYKAGDNPTLHFDLDLAKDVNNFFDPEIDVDFDLVFICANGKISLELQNPVVEAFYWGSISIFTTNLDDYNLGNFNTPFCPSIKVNGDGSVRVGL